MTDKISQPMDRVMAVPVSERVLSMPLSDRVLILETQVAMRDARIEDALSVLSRDVAEIKEYATKWRGGFVALVALGTLLAGLVAGWDHIIHLFSR